MTEGERIIRLETKMDDIEKKVDNGFAAVMNRLDSLDEKFAAKWVEQAIKWTVVTIIGAVLLYSLSQILK